MALTHSTALNCPSVTFLTLVLIHIFLFPLLRTTLRQTFLCLEARASPVHLIFLRSRGVPGQLTKIELRPLVPFCSSFSHYVLAVLFRTPAFRESKRSVPASVLTVEPS
ncbi:hypothetical protein CBS11852_10983 [Aspergillus niger]|nr:hypothetical protein CBS11852_10983 [Aspergillus niger]